MTPVLIMPVYFVCCLGTSLPALCDKNCLLRQPGASEQRSCRGAHHPSVVNVLGSSSSCWWLKRPECLKARLSNQSAVHGQASLSFAFSELQSACRCAGLSVEAGSPVL